MCEEKEREMTNSMLMSLLLIKFEKESKHEWTESRGFEHARDNTCWSLVLLLAYNNIRLILIEKEKKLRTQICNGDMLLAEGH